MNHAEFLDKVGGRRHFGDQTSRNFTRISSLPVPFVDIRALYSGTSNQAEVSRVKGSLISDTRRVFDYGRQHEIPERAFDLYRRTRELSLSYWEQEAIRVSLNSPDGALRRLLETKAARQGVSDPQTTYKGLAEAVPFYGD
jgi:hypothetical protein